MTSKYAYKLERGKLAVFEKSSNKWVSIKTSGLTLRIFGIGLADHFGDNLDYSNMMPLQFHESLAYKAIAMGYKDPRNLNIEVASYFDMEYDKTIKEAKKYARSNNKMSTQIRQGDM